jgi:glycosyltransferase involved in cell wall biosynthesis
MNLPILLITKNNNKNQIMPDNSNKFNLSKGFFSLHTPVYESPAKNKNAVCAGICAVIPAYNEELTIGSVVVLTKPYVDRVIVIDDGSTDKTEHVAKLAGAEVIIIYPNSGKAYAVLLGLLRARELGCDAVVLLDGDGQHCASDIPRVTASALTGEADLVIGSRFLEHHDSVPLYRRFGQKTLDLLTNITNQSNVTDSQSGFRALSRRALDFICFKSIGYNVESDMIAHFSANGLVIKEVPIGVRYDVPNQHKKNPVKQGVCVLSRLITLIGYRRPLLAFGIPGSVLMVGGMGVEIWVFSVFFSSGIFHYIISIGSAFFLLLGMLLGITGLLLNTLVLIMKENS